MSYNHCTNSVHCTVWICSSVGEALVLVYTDSDTVLTNKQSNTQTNKQISKQINTFDLYSPYSQIFLIELNKRSVSMFKVFIQKKLSNRDEGNSYDCPSNLVLQYLYNMGSYYVNIAVANKAKNASNIQENLANQLARLNMSHLGRRRW